MTRSPHEATPSNNKPGDDPADSATSDDTPSDDMARADFANGERPEQPVSREHAEHDRRRTTDSDD
ncbi:MAG TPA: hypothetical protein VE487_18830 [Ilumatobacter sp.]|nr:hypothetical protein [Ilumatobacter sp.]